MRRRSLQAIVRKLRESLEDVRVRGENSHIWEYSLVSSNGDQELCRPFAEQQVIRGPQCIATRPRSSFIRLPRKQSHNFPQECLSYG